MTRQRLAISYAVSVSPAIFEITSFFTGRTKVRCENKVKEGKNKYRSRSDEAKHQKSMKTENFSNTSEIHLNPPYSHTHIIFFLSRLKIFLTSRTTRFSAPLSFYVSMATSEGSPCYYHQSLTSQPSSFTLSALMDWTFFCFD